MGRAQFLHPLHIQLANGGNGYSAPKHPSAISPLRLTLREYSTRVQLQRQRLKEQRATAIVSNTIPGFKTSAAFFASLRTNLRLHTFPPASPISTPPSLRGSATSLPLSQPVESPMESTFSVPPEDPLAGVPELRSYVTDSDEDKTAALKLVADSVAQMRQTANNALIWHPLNLAIVVALLALVARYTYETRQNTFLTGTTCAGIIMILLAGSRYMTQGYLFAAEVINWKWLDDADVIVTTFGEEVIGTVIVQWISGESRQKRKKAWRGEILAWSVRLRYRRKGVGGALLEEAVKEAKKKGAETIEFADDHANSKRVLPSIYNSTFDKRERRGRELLADLLETGPGRGSPSKRKRRGDSR